MSGRAQPAVGASLSACLLGPSRGCSPKPSVWSLPWRPESPVVRAWALETHRPSCQPSSAAPWPCGPELLRVPLPVSVSPSVKWGDLSAYF